MQITDISFIAVLIILILTWLLLGTFSFIDRKFMTRVLRVYLYYIVSMGFIAVYAWFLVKLSYLWAALLGGMAVTAILAYLTVVKSRQSMKSFLWPVFLAQSVGMSVGVGVMLLLLKVSSVACVTAFVALLSGSFLLSTSAALKTYMSCLQHTREHYLYLLSNGATHREAVMPSVRRALRAAILPMLQPLTSPVFVAPPVLFSALFLAGVAPLTAAVVACLYTLLSVAMCLFSAVLLIVLVDHIVFDKSCRLNR